MRPLALRPSRLSPAPLPSAVRRALHPPSNPGGFGLIEFLAVAGAGALLATAAVMMYQRSDVARSVAVEQANVAAIAQNVQRVYAGRNAFGDLSNASALNQGIYPSGMVPARDGFATIANAWGGAVSVAGTTIDGGIPGNGYTIAYSNVPPSACAAFATAAGNGFDEVTVRQSALSSRDPHVGSVLSSTTRKVDPTLASQRCASGPSTVAFTRATFPPVRTTCAGSGPIPPNADVQTASCPETGTTNALPQLISDTGPDQYQHVWQQTRSQDGACGPSGNVVWGPWSAWDPPHACADQCVPFSGSTTANRLTSCPVGQLVSAPGPHLYQSSWPQTQTTTTIRTCSTPIGPLGGPQVSISPWTPVLACAPACSAPPASTSTAARACPAGQLDAQPPYTSNGITDTTVRTYACGTPIGPLTHTDATTTQNRCAPACVVPTPSTESRCTSPVQSTPCPPGQIGAHTFRMAEARSAACAAPTGAFAWSPWATTGARCDESDTCAPPPCVHTPSPVLSQIQACGAGTSGSWTQTRTCSESACPAAGGPTTWACAPWAPTTAPPGSCAPICAPVSTACPAADRGGYTVNGPYTNASGTFCTETKACPAGYNGTNTSYRTDYTAATPTTCANWSPWGVYSPGTGCSATPPGCTWPAAPTTTPACPAPYASTPQTGQWVHGATCPAWVWQQTAPCPSCSWPSPPSTTPACPGGGNQQGGTWVHGATCPDWTYSGGTCPPPPAPTLYPYCNGRSGTSCMSTVGPPPMGGPPAQGGVSAIVNDDTSCCHTMSTPADWSIGWSGVAGGSVATGCAASGNGTNNQCMIIGACGDGYTATATVRHLPTNTTRTYVFTYACEVRH